jgi:hypothetical protein
MLTFGVMAATIAVLTFLYGLGAVLLTHFLAERMRANPLIGRVLKSWPACSSSASASSWRSPSKRTQN